MASPSPFDVFVSNIHDAAMAKGKLWYVIIILIVALAPSQASAQLIVSFYSHEFGSTFPHAFVTVQGRVQSTQAPVDVNFGFTAKSLSPAILMGSVVGEVETLKPAYVAGSDKQFSLAISDTQYAALLGIVQKWRMIPGKSYNLNQRNCIHFVGDIAQSIGLKVSFARAIIKKPRSFLREVLKLNPHLGGSPTGVK
jgi:hypothetical protein